MASPQHQMASPEWFGFDTPAASQQLARTIEGEIIPRLMLVHGGAGMAMPQPAVPQTDDIEEFGRLVLAHDFPVARSFVEALRVQGVALESIYLDLLAGTARLLGTWWEEDRATFSDVTLGLWRLQQVLHALGPDFRGEMQSRRHGRRVLLAPAPGDQHTFGLSVVSDFMRRAGWDVHDERLASRDDLVRTVHREWFNIVALSLGGDRGFENLATTIRAIRRASRNRSVGIMVGGAAFAANPELARLAGADVLAVDGRDAVEQARNLVGLLAKPA